MKANLRHRSWLAVVALVAAPLAVQAIGMPQEQTQDRLTFVNGGVSKDEADMVKQMASQYPLRVVLARGDGAYSVADHVTVLRDGQALGTIDNAGPWLLLKVPPGHYTLEANFGGVTQRRDVNVGGGGKTLQWVAPRTS